MSRDFVKAERRVFFATVKPQERGFYFWSFQSRRLGILGP